MSAAPLLERDWQDAPAPWHTGRRRLATVHWDAPAAVYLRGDRIAPAHLALCFGSVEAGLVAAVRADWRGQRAIVELRGTGATLGEHNLTDADSGDPTLHFEALVPTRVRWADPTVLRSHTGDGTDGTDGDGTLSQAVMAVVATRVRQQYESACHHRLQSLSQRVAAQLVALSHESVLGSDEPALAHLSRFDLARIVGTDRSAASKICSGFARRGWCETEGRSVVVIDEPALLAHATKGLPDALPRLRERLLSHQSALTTLVAERSTASRWHDAEGRTVQDQRMTQYWTPNGASS